MKYWSTNHLFHINVKPKTIVHAHIQNRFIFYRCHWVSVNVWYKTKTHVSFSKPTQLHCWLWFMSWIIFFQNGSVFTHVNTHTTKNIFYIHTHTLKTADILVAYSLWHLVHCFQLLYEATWRMFIALFHSL